MGYSRTSGATQKASTATSASPQASSRSSKASKASQIGNSGMLATLGFSRGTTQEEPASSPPAADGNLQSGLSKVDRMIASGGMVYPEAAANLSQWRYALGDRVMPAEAFTGSSAVIGHLSGVHRAKFVEGAEKRLADGRLVDGGSAEMDWTDSMYAAPMTDLFFALGGFTVHSHVRVRATKQADDSVEIAFESWSADISDEYNWDPGKSTMVPGIGEVTDEEMLAIEQAGFGKAFHVTGAFVVDDASVIGPATLAAP